MRNLCLGCRDKRLKKTLQLWWELILIRSYPNDVKNLDNRDCILKQISSNVIVKYKISYGVLAKDYYYG